MFLSGEFRWTGTRYLLTYKTHLPIDDLVRFLDTATGSVTIINMKIAWEMAHTESTDQEDSHDYPHTHVVLQFDKPGEWYEFN